LTDAEQASFSGPNAPHGQQMHQQHFTWDDATHRLVDPTELVFLTRHVIAVESSQPSMRRCSHRSTIGDTCRS
jgi:hypothetical protein